MIRDEEIKRLILFFLYSGDNPMSNQKSTTNTKNIEVGKFYLIFFFFLTGHPGFVFWKDDEKNRYLVIITESDKFGNKSKRETDKRHLTDLDYPTESKVAKSYIKKRPMLCKRKDIGKKELIGMQFHDSDFVKVLYVSKQKPVMSPSNKNKNNR